MKFYEPEIDDFLYTFENQTKWGYSVHTEDRLIELLKKHQEKSKVFPSNFIVFIRFQYNNDTKWHYTCSLLEYDIIDDSWTWEYDWYEGQKHIDFLGFVDLNELTDAYIDYYKREYNDN